MKQSISQCSELKRNDLSAARRLSTWKTNPAETCIIEVTFNKALGDHIRSLPEICRKHLACKGNGNLRDLISVICNSEYMNLKLRTDKYLFIIKLYDEVSSSLLNIICVKAKVKNTYDALDILIGIV